MGKFIDLTGKRFGRLTVIDRAGRDKNHLVLWRCQCDCGVPLTVRGQDIRRGKIVSCGCRRAEALLERNFRHGMTGTRPYRIWKAMHTRCYNPRSHSFPDYGGRGIKMCERWRDSFQNFWEDMKDGYADGLEIDRIDNNGDYCKENCRWVTDAQQNRNKRNNRYIETSLGRMTMAELAETAGASYDTTKRRLNLGWTGDEVLAGVRAQC